MIASVNVLLESACDNGSTCENGVLTASSRGARLSSCLEVCALDAKLSCAADDATAGLSRAARPV